MCITGISAHGILILQPTSFSNIVALLVYLQAKRLQLQWNLSYPGSLAFTTVRISETSVTKNCMLYL